MAHWLTKLRKKPKHIRENIAFGSSIGMTLAVAMVWFITGGSPDMASDIKQDPGFFKTFKEGFDKQMAAARESLSTSTTTTQNTADTEPAVATTDLVSTSSATTTIQKPVLIEIINASGTASSAVSSSL